MIKSITMKNCATYSGSGTTISDCKKVNFIYGANGSGKSTISTFLSNPTTPMFSDCSIEYSSDDRPEILVYNRDFKSRHLRGDIAGVFTLGESTIEQKEELRNLKNKRDGKNDELNKLKNVHSVSEGALRKLNQDFQDTVWRSILKENEAQFQEAFKGFLSSKKKFADEIIRRCQVPYTPSNPEATKEDLCQRATMLFDKTPEVLPSAIAPNSSAINTLCTTESNSIWSNVIVGNTDLPVAQLINFLGNSDWVNQGRKYIGLKPKCPFCQQDTLSEEFISLLNDFFSGSYEKSIAEITDLISNYRRLSAEIHTQFINMFPNPAIFNVLKVDLDKYFSLCAVLKLAYESNIRSMDEKIKQPSRKIYIGSTQAVVGELLDIIDTANKQIQEHNDIVDNLATQRKILIDDIWHYLIDINAPLIEGYISERTRIQKKIDGLSKSINKGQLDISALDSQITSANKNMIGVQPTVDEINRLLSSYGFTNFKIAVSPKEENAYQIQRPDGTLATATLSEGEETFISFLYFMQLAKGAADPAKVSEKRILVLDDPICSLDSTVLYLVSSIVKSLLADVRDSKSDVIQVFILTHNVYFHKEASFLDQRTKVHPDVNYWVINKNNNISCIQSYDQNNPIKSSYELLWNDLKNNPYASVVSLQNIMRRIIENYFGILGSCIDSAIINSFETNEDKLVCRSLISWYNDGSHCIPDDLYIDSYSDSTDRYKEVFRKIFVQMGHEAHYNMMMGIVS